MGPRPGGRGEALAASGQVTIRPLQWGRAPEGAERA